ncbi:MAG TPA: protein kinase [Bryobacteraceae bacterium]|nr:protein kinase [Bryobacteraceae bacterium]
MPLSPGYKLGPYEILATIGKGGMGEVYRAHDTRLRRDVAIKVSTAQFSERFEVEAKAIAALNHPNICQIYDVGPNFLVMEFIEGESPKGPMPLDEALRIARQIADALGAAHDKGITHRDLKPGNIKIKPDGTVKVLDFGLAKVMAAPSASGENSRTLTMGMTQAGMILGTASYMAPEQARGKENVDKRADIWAFGVVLYELLTGKPIFTGEDVGEILAKVIRDDPDLSSAPPRVVPLLKRCLEKDPKKRLRDIGDAELLLSRDNNGAVPIASAAPSLSRLGKIAMIAAATLAIVSVALGVVAYRATRPQEKSAVRMDIDLEPDRTVRAGFGPDVILSPDGARLAYLSQDRLFTRRLDQSQGTELPGTRGAVSPFFSPDGQWIAFAAGGKLKKISVVGGAAVTLCDAPFFLGGSWGEDGAIVASLNQSGGLFRIPADGGAAVALTQLARREATHRWPQILPGGKTVLFTSNTNPIGGFDDAAIQAVSLVDGRRKTLRQGGTFGRYLPASKGSGHLIYVNRGTLFAVPFDAAALEARGPAVPILEQVAYSALHGPAKLDASPSGTLVYENGGSDAGLVILQSLEEGGKTGPLLAKPGNYGRPSFSPDGRRLALEIQDGGNQDIWVQDLERDTVTRLTFEGKEHDPIWTPDGRSIVYQDPEGMSWTRADGGGKPQSLLRTKGLAWPWSISPDGKRLAYFELGTLGYDLWSVPIEGDGVALRARKPEALLQTPFDKRYPVFSPDERWLAYMSNESGAYEIYVRAFPDASSGGGKWQISSGGGTYPMWSRTARQLFFETLDNRVMAAAYTVQGNSFVAEKPRPWSERQLANLVNSSRNIDLAPDGKRFAVILPVEQAGSQQARSRVTFIENFSDEVRRKAPAGK